MKTNGKIISIICVMAMIFSLLSGFAVQAAETRGMNVTLDEENSTDLVKVLKVNYVGFDVVNSLQFKLPIDPTMYESIAFGWSDEIIDYSDVKTVNVRNGALAGTITDGVKAVMASVDGLSCENGVFATITLTLKEALKEDLVLTLEDLVTQGDGEDKPATGLVGGSVTIEAPEAEAPVAPGIDLELDPSSTDTVKIINAYYKGMDEGIASFTIDITTPEGIVESIYTESKMFGMMADCYFEDENYYAVAGISALNTTSDDGLFATIVMTLTQPLTEDFVMQLIGDTYIADDNAEGVFVSDGSMVADYIELKASESTDTPAPTAVNTVLGKYVGAVDGSEATAVISEINPNGNSISSIEWMVDKYAGTYNGTTLSGQSTVYFGLIVPFTLDAAAGSVTDEIATIIK